MTWEIEQLFLEMLAALKRAPDLTPWQKYEIATRLEDRAARAAVEFLKEDERRMDARETETAA